MATHKLLEILALTLIAVSSSSAARYKLAESYVGSDFYDKFTFRSLPDPTHGRVNYLSQADALAKNLISATNDTFIMRADSTTTLDPSGPGRDSVRVQSNEAFGKHVLIMDIRHMPEGCATWPAAWELGPGPWPAGGEIDIIEGVNGQRSNQATLHTTPGCTMLNNTMQTGNFVSLNCDAETNANAGCSVTTDKANSFAGEFNTNGGGWYVMQLDHKSIRHWFWSRNDAFVPNAVKNAPTSIDTGDLGVPYADFHSTSCDIDTYFASQNIVFDLTFCGDFAGSLFASDGCGSDCESFVNNNPSAFVDAYWNVASVKVYQ